MVAAERRRIFVSVLVGWTLGMAVPAASAAGTDAQRCERVKLGAARAMVSCQLGRAIPGGRCSTRLEAAFRRAETKAGVAGCPTRLDAAAVAARVDGATRAIRAALSGIRFVDNGDGTITDNQTGLMWEKKDGADGVPNPDDPHDVDNYYPWSVSGMAPDGPAYTQFLARLNDCVSTDGVAVTGGFAGHCDWRLPTMPELATTLDAGIPGCGTGPPCIAAIFGPTQPYFYFSSTTNPAFPRLAWIVNYYEGLVLYGGKVGLKYARAVRGGR